MAWNSNLCVSGPIGAQTKFLPPSFVRSDLTTFRTASLVGDMTVGSVHTWEELSGIAHYACILFQEILPHAPVRISMFMVASKKFRHSDDKL